MKTCERIETLMTQAFVAGQMDAQATELEKWKVGRGGQMRALSRRIYALAEQTAADLLAATEPENADRGGPSEQLRRAVQYAVGLMQDALAVASPYYAPFIRQHIAALESSGYGVESAKSADNASVSPLKQPDDPQDSK